MFGYQELVLFFLCTSTFVNYSQSDPLDILIVSVPFVGHAFRVLAIGEELVRRGHNVTFCSLDNWVNLKDKALERGMQYMSAGKHGVSEAEWRDFVGKRVALSSRDPFSLLADFRLLANSKLLLSFDSISSYLVTLDFNHWDIVIIEEELLHTVPCIAKSRKVPVVAVTITYFSNESPSWPFPAYQSGYSSDLGFKERTLTVLTTVAHRFLSTFSLKRIIKGSPVTETLCKQNFKYPIDLGWEIPLIIITALGLEYPRTISPLTDYVGPILSQKLLHQSLPNQLSEWLKDKETKSVIYIGMGSLLSVSSDMARAFIDGISDTNYSVIWSLNKLNQDILSDIKLDNSRYFISSWIPQIRLFQHTSISIAILHGGYNSVHESLYFGIPCIVMPFVNDQFDWAIRVQDARVGIQLHPHQVTSSAIRESIAMIDAGGYHERAQIMKVLMKRAGGLERASDLVEFYGTYGYDHLIPAPVKYKWNWIQYYNIDVYMILVCSMLVFFWACRRCCCSCCCSSMRRKKLKHN